MARRSFIVASVTVISFLGAAALAAPAQANGYAFGHGVYGPGYYNAGFRHGRYYHGRRGFRRGHYRGQRGGGEVAAIALGVIGGAIIINEIAEDRRRDRYHEDMRYRRRVSSFDDRYDDGFDDGYERGRAAAESADNSPSDNSAPLDGVRRGSFDSDIESQLDGGPEPIRISYDTAYQTCIQHARNALGNRGFVLSAPFRPDTAEEAGVAWKMTATVNAERGGESWSRAMYCEASENRVFMLELI